MIIRKDGVCEFCEESLEGMTYEETHTRDGHDYCSYECLEAAHGDEELETENDFLSSKIS